MIAYWSMPSTLHATIVIDALLVLGCPHFSRASKEWSRRSDAQQRSAPTVATVLFPALWLVIAAANMWVGVAKAGYSVAAELPIFALIFGVPAALTCHRNFF